MVDRRLTTIQTANETGELHINIKDLSGRTVMLRNIIVKGFFATLDIQLINGAYLIYISNKANETTIKKLLISK